MSLLNIHVAPERAFVGVDTLAHRGDGRPQHMSKLFALTHVGGVLAVRGSVGFSLVLLPYLLYTPGDFDAIVAAAAKSGPVWEEASKRARAEGVELAGGPAGCAEFVLAGYSPREGRVVGKGFAKDSLVRPFVPFEVGAPRPGFMTAPGIADCAIVPSDAASMLELARLQVKAHRAAAPAIHVGGRLILAEVTRAGISIRDVGEIEAETAPASAVPANA